MNAEEIDKVLKNMAETESKASNIISERLDKKINNTLYNLNNIKAKRMIVIKVAICACICTCIFILLSINPQETIVTKQSVFSNTSKGVTWNPEKNEYYNSDELNWDSYNKRYVPKGVTWNPETGHYYDSDSFIWDSNKKCYMPILKISNENLGSQENISELKEQWLITHKASSDRIDIAILQFDKNMQQELLNNKNLAFSSHINVNDPAFNAFLSLNIIDLSNMLSRISNNDIWSIEIEEGIKKITNIKDNSLCVTNNSKWIKNFNSKISSAGPKIKDYSLKIKKGVDSNTQAQIDNDIQSFGIFAVPYLMDEINNGNKQMIKYLPSLLDNYTHISENELKKKDINYWKNWYKNNKSDMDILKKLCTAAH